MKALREEGRLLSIAGFWKNDQPDGLGVELLPQLFSEPLESVWKEIMQSWQMMWDEEEDKQKLVEELFEQLRGSVNSKDNFHAAVIALGNIWLLERYGYIEADEFNGMQFASLDGMYTAVPRNN